MRVGFAGPGRMGARMAGDLARGPGHSDVAATLWNRTPAKAQEPGAQLGRPVAATPRALSDAGDVVITMPSDDPGSEMVRLGPDGLFAGAARVCPEMGTMSPDHIDALAESAPDGVRAIDAPVSGATQAADADTALLIMAGCDQGQARDLLPLCRAMGRQTVFPGRRGAAAGAPMLSYRRPLCLNEADHDVTFAIARARKDMDVTTALADRPGVAMPQIRVARDKLRQAETQGRGPATWRHGAAWRPRTRMIKRTAQLAMMGKIQ